MYAAGGNGTTGLAREEGKRRVCSDREDPNQRNRKSVPRATSLGPTLLSGNHPHPLPRPLGPFWRGLVAIDDAVVLIGFADGTQRFVVEAGQVECFFQFFGELLQRFQMFGGGANFGLGGFEHLLVAAVDELRDLTSDQIAGIGENLDRL